MKIIYKISIPLLTLLIFSINSVSQVESNQIEEQDSVKWYLNNGYIIKDSIEINYDDNSKGLILSMINKNENSKEYQKKYETPLKRLFLMYSRTGDNYQLALKSFNVFPSLAFGERSDVGYYSLKHKKNMFSFKVLILPNSNNNEFEIEYSFVYDLTKKKWYLSDCLIEKSNNDEVVKSYHLNNKNFGAISLDDFNIYEFNPFVLL